MFGGPWRKKTFFIQNFCNLQYAPGYTGPEHCWPEEQGTQPVRDQEVLVQEWRQGQTPVQGQPLAQDHSQAKRQEPHPALRPFIKC